MRTTIVIIKINKLCDTKEAEAIYQRIKEEIKQGFIMLPAFVTLEAIIHQDETMLCVKDASGMQLFPPILNAGFKG